MNPPPTDPAILGCLIGTALGDSLGLPGEGLSRSRIMRWWGPAVRHRFFVGKGMVSDDTEQTLLAAKACHLHPTDILAFQKRLAASLRWWFLALPAGVGLSTAKACLRLWLGIPTSRSGVKSAGNGAAMRSAIIGVLCYQDATPERLLRFTEAGARITHTDDRAVEAALLVAQAAALAAQQVATEQVLLEMENHIRTPEMRTRWEALLHALNQQLSVEAYARAIGCADRVTGYAPDTVAVALYAWLRHRHDFRQIITELIHCGGDTDSIAAIAGGIAGAETALADFPEDWLHGYCDWPYSRKYLLRLAKTLSSPGSRLPCLFWIGIPLRNLGFLITVIAHGLRRLLPPY